MADIIVEKVFNQPIFTWDAGDLVRQNDTRTQYLKALRKADRHDFEELIGFSRQ